MTKESYDYLKDSIMSEKDIQVMLERNPYKKLSSVFWGFLPYEIPEHRYFNKIYNIAYLHGVTSKFIELGKLLREYGIEKEEIRQLFNKALGKEILKKVEDED